MGKLKLIDIDPSGKALTTPAPQGTGNGLALMNNALAHVARPLRLADQCRQLLHDGLVTSLGTGDLSPRLLDRATAIHGVMLRDIVEMGAAASALLGVVIPPTPKDIAITYPAAVSMLSVLFGALSKRKADADDGNAAALLAACADMFSPTSASIGASTGLWSEVSHHPVVLALACKKLLASSVFQPSPSEVREAMRLCRQRVSVLANYAYDLVEIVERADEIVFTFDRPTWEQRYAKLDEATLAARLKQLKTDEAYLGDDDEDVPATSRWLALNELVQRSLAAPKLREAACSAPPAKRTRKPRPSE